MTAQGQQRRLRPRAVRSGLPLTSDMTRHRPNGCDGPKCEELDVSKSGPPCLAKQTSMTWTATSLMGRWRISESLANGSWADGHLSQVPVPVGSSTESARSAVFIHPFCFSFALLPSELLERSSKRSAPLARSCPVLLSFFASSLAVASRKPSAARSPAFDDFRSSSIAGSFLKKTPPRKLSWFGRTTFQSDRLDIVPGSVEALSGAAASTTSRTA